MPKYVLLNEIHVKIRVPTNMPEHEIRTIRKMLLSRQISREFLKSVRDLLTANAIPGVCVSRSSGESNVTGRNHNHSESWFMRRLLFSYPRVA